VPTPDASVPQPIPASPFAGGGESSAVSLDDRPDISAAAPVSPGAGAAFEWSEDAVKLLRLYWAEGLSTRLIGKHLGCGKNAVVGKVHRLGLPGRPSPVRYGSCVTFRQLARARTLIEPGKQGKGFAATARKLGLGRTALTNALRRAATI
jgi:hypothetical protein